MEQRLIDVNKLAYDCDYNNGWGCDKICSCEGCVHRVITEKSINEAPTVLTIPKNPTNGDIIKAMFPDVEVKEKNNVYEIYFGVGTCIQFFNHQWWNASYKRGEEDEDNN